MPFIDHTDDFKHIVKEKWALIPEFKRRKFSRPRNDVDGDFQAGMGKEFLAEAYKIVRSIRPLPP